jgi:uncharacterized DUF497 family protein
MHPSFAEHIEWDEGNEPKLASHRISTEEVEDLLYQSPRWLQNPGEGRSGHFKVVGITSAGRALTIIFEWKEITRSLRPITGWDTSKGEGTKYL